MPDQFWALVVFALVATGSPGGATTLATASGARFGFRRTVPLIFGIAFALALLMAVSGTGLAATLKSNAFLELSVKAIGSVYLLWLAVRIGLAGPPKKTEVDTSRPTSLPGGAVLLLINPKAWAMAMGVASSFSDMVSEPIVLGAILAGTFVFAASFSLSVWALAGGVVARLFSFDWHWHVFNGLMAVLLAVTVIQFWF